MTTQIKPLKETEEAATKAKDDAPQASSSIQHDVDVDAEILNRKGSTPTPPSKRTTLQEERRTRTV